MTHTEEDQRRKQPPVGGVQATEPPDFFEALAIADCLAQKFVSAFPSKDAHPEWRGYLRSNCVPGLRWLWRNGDAATRTTLAARVAVWRQRKEEDVKALQRRIRARETARKGGQ